MTPKLYLTNENPRYVNAPPSHHLWNYVGKVKMSKEISMNELAYFLSKSIRVSPSVRLPAPPPIHHVDYTICV